MKVFIADYGNPDSYRDSNWWDVLTGERFVFASLESAKKFVEDSQPKNEWFEDETWKWFDYPERGTWYYSTDGEDDSPSQSWFITETEVKS